MTELSKCSTSVGRWVLRLAAGFVVVAIGLIIYAANAGISHPGGSLVAALPYGDKIAHLILFGLLTLVINLVLQCRKLRVGSTEVLLGSAMVAAFVIVEELSQGFVDNRTLDVVDLAADALGIAGASFAASAICRRWG